MLLFFISETVHHWMKESDFGRKAKTCSGGNENTKASHFGLQPILIEWKCIKVQTSWYLFTG